MFEKNTLVPAGTTTVQNPGPTLSLGDTYATVAFVVTVTAAGGTPALTWKIQGSVDGTNFYDIIYVTDISDALDQKAAISGPTAAGQKVIFLANPLARRYKFYRAVVTTDTNVTYGIDAYQIGN